MGFSFNRPIYKAEMEKMEGKSMHGKRCWGQSSQSPTGTACA